MVTTLVSLELSTKAALKNISCNESLSYVIILHNIQHPPVYCYNSTSNKAADSDLYRVFGVPLSLGCQNHLLLPVELEHFFFHCLVSLTEAMSQGSLCIFQWDCGICAPTPTAPEFCSNQTKVVDQPPRNTYLETHAVWLVQLVISFLGVTPLRYPD